jgi:effector-binding domain-containing protein
MDATEHGAVTLQELAAQPILSIRATIPVARLGEEMGDRIAVLTDYLQRSGGAPAGPVFVRYHTFGDSETDMETGLPVVTPVAGAGRVAAGMLRGGTVVATWHFGAHQALGEAYARVQTWLHAHSRAPDGPPWEVYHWIDPRRPPDPTGRDADHTTWGTQLVQPIKPGTPL